MRAIFFKKSAHYIWFRASYVYFNFMPIFRYGGNTFSTILFSAIYGATVLAITQPGLVPEEVLWYGQAANIPMIVIGKLIQAITNFKNGHTGQLSAITVFLLTLGSLARIFTSIQDTGDQVSDIAETHVVWEI